MDNSAFLTYLNALRLIKCPRQIFEAHGDIPPVPEVYKEPQPVTLLDEDICPPEGVPVSRTLERPYTIEEKQAVLRANAGVIVQLKQSLQAEWPVDAVVDDGESIVSRTAWRLLKLQGDVYTYQDKYAEAADAFLDSLDTVVRFPPHHGLGRIGGTLFQFDSCLGLQNLEKNLSSTEMQLVLNRMSDIAARIPDYRKEWDAEKTNCITHLMEICSGSFWRILSGNYISDITGISFLKLLVYSKKQLFIEIEKRIDDYFEQVATKKSITKDSDIKTGSSILLLTPTFLSHLRFQVIHSRLLFDLIMLRWAVRVYKDEQGRYPDSLKDLTGKYLSSIPNDPFSDNEMYKYKVEDDTYTLYSIGPDCIDSGGTLVEGLIMHGLNQPGDVTDAYVVECAQSNKPRIQRYYDLQKQFGI